MNTAVFPAYVGGDRFAYADIEQRWAVCDRNDVCDFEGYAEVEWVSRTEGRWTCPKCDHESSYEID